MEKKKKKTPADIDLRDKASCDITTGDPIVQKQVKETNTAAIALGKLGRLKGGKTRGESLSAKKKNLTQDS